MIVANLIQFKMSNAKKWNISFERYFPEIGHQWVNLQDVRRKTSTVCAYTLFPHPERRNSKMPWIKWKFGAFKWRTQIQERLWSDHRSKLFRNFTNKLHDWYQPSIREFSQCLRTIYDCSASIYTTLYVFVSKISVCRSKHLLTMIRFNTCPTNIIA